MNVTTNIFDVRNLPTKPLASLPNRFVTKGAEFFKLGGEVKTRDYYFILLPKLTMLAFCAAIEPMRYANQLTGKCLYRWHLLSEDGSPVESSNGITIAVDGEISSLHHKDTLFVCAGLEGMKSAGLKTINLLRTHARNGGQIGGICTGVFALARAGLLNGKSFTVHWENRRIFAEYFPDLTVSDGIFIRDRKVITCCGGAASVEMMIDTIKNDYGENLALLVSDMCLSGTSRQGWASQKSSVANYVGSRNKKLIAVIYLMQGNIEEPLGFEEIVKRSKISKRQIERLFKFHLGTTPGRYYRNLRVDHGRALLRETEMSVLEVAMACGFSSPSNFSNVYLRRFGKAPAFDK